MFNPDMMKNLMNNEEIQKMMSDPNIMNNIQNMMGNMGDMGDMSKLFGGMSDTNPENKDCCDENGNCNPENKDCCDENGNCNELKLDDLTSVNIENDNGLTVGDKIITQNLKTESYNNQFGQIEDYNTTTNRFIILLDDGRTAALKEENLQNRYENIDNID